MSRVRRALMLLACLAVSFLPGVIGGRSEPGAWYRALERPALTPPGPVFPIAWTILYAAIGVALYLAVRASLRARGGRPLPAAALALFAAHLALNAAWPWLFFGLERPAVALAALALLWVVSAALTVSFWRLRPLAGALLLPYLAWLTFAAYLNAGVVILNP